MTARSERPISREISWVRPPILPRTDSRSLRVLVEAGSMAYSAVTQPRPEPLRQRGTPSEAEAAHRTLVPPNSIRTEPAAWSNQLRVMVIGRSSSLARPSARRSVTGRQSTGMRKGPAPPPWKPDPQWSRQSSTNKHARTASLLHFGAHDAPDTDRQRKEQPDQTRGSELAQASRVHRRAVEQRRLGEAEVNPWLQVADPADQRSTQLEQAGQDE